MALRLLPSRPPWVCLAPRRSARAYLAAVATPLARNWFSFHPPGRRYLIDRSLLLFFLAIRYFARECFEWRYGKLGNLQRLHAQQRIFVVPDRSHDSDDHLGSLWLQTDKPGERLALFRRHEDLKLRGRRGIRWRGISQGLSAARMGGSNDRSRPTRFAASACFGLFAGRRRKNLPGLCITHSVTRACGDEKH